MDSNDFATLDAPSALIGRSSTDSACEAVSLTGAVTLSPAAQSPNLSRARDRVDPNGVVVLSVTSLSLSLFEPVESEDTQQSDRAVRQPAAPQLVARRERDAPNRPG